jgi:hypothetical protein
MFLHNYKSIVMANNPFSKYFSFFKTQCHIVWLQLVAILLLHQL